MPITVNSVGTAYSGSANLSVRRDRCQHCGHVVDLSSYDTRLFFVALFIPLIPLARKRIINECSSCRKHYAMPLAVWERDRIEKLGGAVAEWTADRDNPALAARAVATAVAFQAKDEFVAMTRSFTPALARDADFLAMIGDAYGHFGMPQEQAAAYRGSLSLAGSPLVQRALGMRLLYDGEVDEGVELVRSALRACVEHSAASAFAAVGALQARGRHSEALDVLQELSEGLPAIEREAGFRKLKRISEKHRASGKPVKAAASEGGWVDGPGRRNMSERGWAWLAAGVAALAVAIIIIVGVRNTLAREVWVVNGLSEQAVVRVNGISMNVPPMSAGRLTLAEGSHRVEVVTPAGRVPSVDVDIRTPLYARPFVKPVFVINPDELGVLEHETATFDLNGSVPSRRQTLRGKTLHKASVDYPFLPLPSTLKMSSKSGSVEKTRLDIARSLSTEHVIATVLEQEGAEAMGELVRKGLQRDPKNEAYTNAARLLDPKDVLSLVRPLLASRPLLVDVHRLYQDEQREVNPSHDLLSEYAAQHAADLSNAALAYLTARVTVDRAAQETLLQLASTAAPPEPRAVRMLAETVLGRGEFERALAVARAGRAAGVADDRLSLVERDSLVAMKRYSETLDLPEMAAPAHLLSGHTIRAKVRLLALAGREKEARDLAYETSSQAPGARASLTEYFEWLIKYAQGNVAEAAGHLAQVSSGEGVAIDALVAQGKLTEAAARAAAMEQPSFLVLLHVAAGAAETGDDATLRAVAARMGKMLESAGYWESKLGALLDDAKPCTRQDLEDIHLDIDNRAAFMVVVAALRPPCRSEALRLAKLLNPPGQFPSHLVDRAIERLAR
ncbi:MAG TPA: hypothetical protein VEB22_14110 [Phycisphaerales bacterium]|nr:hypothetical protein [Phycisphaerales bacterium]